MRKAIIFSIIALTGILFSCSKDSLDPTLAQSKAVETSIRTVEDLQGLLYGAYNRMTSYAYYGRDYIIHGEVRSDNTFSNGNSGRFVTVAAMNLGNNDAYVTDAWTQIYSVIASANIIINAQNIEGDEAKINHIKGQAYAIRALAHFDLLKLFGQQHVVGGDATLGVPYIKEYKGEDLLPRRNSVSEVKQFIYDDLGTALSLMSVSLNDPSAQSITTHAVYAIMARVAVYFGEWNTAKTACEAVISANKFQIIPAASFKSIWNTDSPANSIFELAFSSTDNANINGLQYIYRGTSYGDIQVLDDLLNQYEETDVRGLASGMLGYEGIKLRNMGKYPSIDYSDDVFLFRYEEIVLNYAEALFELGDPTAIDWLNKVPAERNASPYAAINKDNILLERRKEFAFEGFRFWDLARTGRDIPLVSPFQQTHGGPQYGSYKYAFPIPKVELDANSNMVQNFGYSTTK
ncbi:MAG: RagB/SusD family nutrient uptake outer membrane protein [Bacteroidales bacterium]|nr:RagB/SusD family nutrient uptake outer membrane protein [Bacteroidales bacterium]